MKFHKDLTPEHWYKFSRMVQLANIGMDIERTIDWKKRDKIEDSKCAFWRALELIELTISDTKDKGGRREILRAREFLIDHFMYNNEYNTTDEFWSEYFYQFAYAAALERRR